MAPFHAMAELKQTAQSKELNGTNINTKKGPLNRQTGLPLHILFFNCQNDHCLDATINFDHVLLPPAVLKSANHSL